MTRTAEEQAPSIESTTVPTRTIHLEEDNDNRLEAAVPPALHRRLSVSGAVEIFLDVQEQRLFQTLMEVTASYNEGTLALPTTENGSSPIPSTPQQQPLTLRVAGGWVRDKLLQLSTHDVDIAVQGLTGVQTAQLLQTYLLQQAQSDPTQSDPAKKPKIGIIAANPDQSKHLETATMKIHGIEVDFCPLRSQEIYKSNSRIPTTSIGTPWQDAMRRDFTLNALFYNLQNAKVEDWTGRGLQDLRSGRLVTPIDAEQTFLDDPLRVLRAIRFAVRYQFALDDRLEQAAQLNAVHHALHVKVSRERVGKELMAMLWAGKGANPIVALRTIGRLQLAGSVFSLPVVGQENVASMQGYIYTNEYHDNDHDGPRDRHIRQVGWEASLRFLEYYVKIETAHNSSRGNSNASTYEPRLSAMIAYLLPFRTLVYREATKQRSFLAMSFVFRHGIKFKSTDVQLVTALLETLPAMQTLLEKAATVVNNNDSSKVERLEAGLVLRRTKASWVTSLIMATVLKIDEQARGESDASIEWIQTSVQLYKTILDFGLDGCWTLKPLLNGKALIRTLALPQGPVVGKFSEEQMRWMLLNPQGSVEDCTAHLHSFKRKLDDDDEMQTTTKGISDGLITSSPTGSGSPHFDKKMHVESMETS